MKSIEKRPLKTLFSVLLASTLSLIPGATLAQVEVGVVGGMAFAGSQDLTIEQRNAQGMVTSVTQEPGLHVDRGRAWGLTMVRWSKSHPPLGLSVDGLYWTDSLKMIDVDASRTPRTLHQERAGIFSSLAGRIPLTRDGETIVYGTLGVGALDSHLIGGGHRIGVGLTMAAGGSVPLMRDRLFAHLETRYLITHDFDSDDSMNQNLEFSGAPSWTTARRVFGPHQDTRFLPMTLGLSWRF
jgi:hypothetical protein